MIPHDKPKICTKCSVQHVENCDRCFGFGVYKGKEIEEVPVAAWEAERVKNMLTVIEWERCPSCGCTPWGIRTDKI